MKNLSNDRLVSRLYKEHLQLNDKMNNPAKDDQKI